MTLTEHYLIFATEDSSPSKRWEIIIPLDSIIIERWGIEEEVRRSQVLGGGGFVTDFGVIGSGFLYDSGKAHHLIIPYMDENGTPQEPRFGVSSFRGKAIREWAATLYQQVVKEKNALASTSSPSPLPDKNPTIQLPRSSSNDNQPAVESNVEDPLKIIRLRFAKGEITREEYEEMRKMLES
jgi:Short C-terminal domain